MPDGGGVRGNGATGAMIERVWYGDGRWPSAARVALSPFELAFRAITAVRNALYDTGVLRAADPGIAVISVGNLTVGGTGKTPIAAHIAGRLKGRGAHPAIVLRGYGGDEILVHERLVPGVIVVADPDRVRGARLAAQRSADVVVLDDAFQHRRIARSADVVLVAAERLTNNARQLPAGPFRESPRSLRRASLILVTRKSASPEDVDRALLWCARWAPDVPTAVARLELGDLRRDADRAPLPSLVGERVLAIAAVGDPRAFSVQLAAAGAHVELASFPDHHAFTDSDVSGLARRAIGYSRAVCTLKDYVKIGPRWPANASPLWYASQRVHIERGENVLDAIISDVFARRRIDTSPGRPAPAAS